MPQVFQVLKCYKCLVFQVHQTKKSNKFQCKMCGEKQSIKRHYGIGTGKDCRLHVQRLNGLRGEMEETSAQVNSDDEFDDNKSDEQTVENVKNVSANAMKRSRWSAFVDKEEEPTEDPTEEPMFLGDREVILEMPQKKKNRKFKVKTNFSNNLEGDLNTSNNTSNLKSESNWKTSDFESENSLNSIQSGAEINNDKKITYNGQVNLKYCDNPTVASKQNSPKKLEVLRTIKRNSKWAQFVDSDDGGTDENKDLSRDMSDLEHDTLLSKTDNLFSLCDDSDLDNVLDF